MLFLIGLYTAVVVTLLLFKRCRCNCHHHCHHQGHDHRRAEKLVLIINGEKVGDQMVILKDDIQANIQIEADDKFGNPVGQLDSPPQFSLSDASFGDLVPSEDGMSCSFNSNGKLGQFQIQVSAPVNGQQLQGTADVQVVAGSAASLKISISQ